MLAALGDLCDEWPVDPDELGELAGELGWFWWDAGEPGAPGDARRASGGGR